MNNKGTEPWLSQPMKVYGFGVEESNPRRAILEGDRKTGDGIKPDLNCRTLTEWRHTTVQGPDSQRCHRLGWVFISPDQPR